MSDFVSEFLGFLARATVWILSRTLDLLCACLLLLVLSNPFYWFQACKDVNNGPRNFKEACVVLAASSVLTWVHSTFLPVSTLS